MSNTFRFEGWNPDKSETIGGDCTAWCEAILWIVPAKVGGRWRASDGELTLTQDFQMVSGTLTVGGKPVPVTGQLNGRDDHAARPATASTPAAPATPRSS